MPIVELHARLVRLPLKRRVQHASFGRETSDNLVVACRLDDGTIGFGEGVPRPYVTGESPEGALAQFAATDWARMLAGIDPTGWPDVISLCSRIAPPVDGDDPRGIRANSLRAAVELSVLDAFGQRFGQPVSAVTPHVAEAAALAARHAQVRYSAAITAEGAWHERISAFKIRLYGFNHCKVKVGMPGGDDVARLGRIRRIVGSAMDLRLDANEAWPADQAAAQIRSLEFARISCVEQPVRHTEVASLAEIRRQVSVPVMLDESLAGPIDADAAIAGGTCDLFNLRLSKCGGFLACLRLAARAAQARLGFQLGCHPGESGILSAAGRHWAASVAGIRYVEGSYDRHLVRERLTQQDLTFGYGGLAPSICTPGWGIAIDQAALERVTLRAHCVRL